MLGGEWEGELAGVKGGIDMKALYVRIDVVLV
jgi:hypothetical protein